MVSKPNVWQVPASLSLLLPLKLSSVASTVCTELRTLLKKIFTDRAEYECYMKATEKASFDLANLTG
jgi:hypothetical protein